MICLGLEALCALLMLICIFFDWDGVGLGFGFLGLMFMLGVFATPC